MPTPTTQPQNPRKRTLPITSSTQPTGHDRKRAKLADARSIAVQSTNLDVKTGQLDVNTFISSREFEIKALRNAMYNSKRANNQRAFQSVPRELRRRTASHNVKRVPKRLQARAAHEMQEDNTPTVTSRRRKPTPHMRLRLETAKALRQYSKLPNLKEKLLSKSTQLQKKAGGNDVGDKKLKKPPRGHSKYRKRQKEKTWLPTHIWHAKRAKMVTRWRFRIAETPTEKSFRPTHRASGLRGAVAWDMSYFSTVMVKGPEDELEEVVKGIFGDVKEVTGKLVKAGKRSAQTWVYRLNEYPTGPIAPVTVIWCADANTGKSNQRQFLIRVHPSAFLELWNTLLAASKSLHSVSLEDLRYEIGSIEITGPSATDSLLTILRPISEPPAENSPEAVWNSLKSLTNPSTLPPGALLAFDVSDPRLQFPPRMTADPQPQEEISKRLFETCSSWPLDKTQKPATLFSRDSRAAAIHSRPSQKNINRRKADAAPGTYPEVLPMDPRIPILLFASRRAAKEKGVNGAIGSWTLMLPWKWVMPVCQVTWEHGMGFFPDDFPGTRAGNEEESRKMKERKEVWERKPKAKRIAWESVPLGDGRKGEVGDGFGCDWTFFCKNGEEKEAGNNKDVDDMDIDHPASTTPDIPLALFPPLAMWTVPSSLVQSLLAPSHSLPPLLASLPPQILSKAVFTVKITCFSRGTPSACARIYNIPSSPALKAQWKTLVDPSKSSSNKEKHRSQLPKDHKGFQKRNRNRKPQAGSTEYPACPGEEDLCGFVTTGGFSLKEGCGTGVGALVFGRVFGNVVDGKVRRVERSCVVRDAGCGVARGALWELV
ncbi:Ribonucleases P/MRP protein subunit pop1 [Rhizina undulata]